jgi:drug/metabolite transporter (DMT)-like permease
MSGMTCLNRRITAGFAFSFSVLPRSIDMIILQTAVATADVRHSSASPHGRLATVATMLRNSGRSGQASNPAVGFFWVTLAMISFSGLAAFGKYAAKAGIDPLQIIFFRNAFCLLFLMPLLVMRGPSIARSSQLKMYGLRVGLALFSMTTWFYAVAMIPLAELTAISFLGPLFATLFAILFLGEVVRARRITALAIGFVGAMIILRPGGTVFGLGQMFALFSALSAGVIGPLLKQMTAKEDADKIVFISNMLLAPFSLIPALFVWQWPDAALWPYLGAMGLCAVIGHISLMRGFASTDASLVFTYEFSRLPFAVLVGYLLFAETVDVWTIVGATVIFASAFYITRREAQLRANQDRVGVRDVSDPLFLTPVPLLSR